VRSIASQYGIAVVKITRGWGREVVERAAGAVRKDVDSGVDG
jgi:hypothetical protein